MAASEPAPEACCAASGSLNQSKEYFGTAFFQRPLTRALVVQASTELVERPKAGGASTSLVAAVERFLRPEPADSRPLKPTRAGKGPISRALVKVSRIAR